jgi:hypothetical protein
MNNEGAKLLMAHFSRWQLVILFVMVAAFTHPLRDSVLGMLGVQPTGVESILGSGVAAGAIVWVTTFVMLRLIPKRRIEPAKKN